ncbi:MAG TPA: flagellar export chaperone FliS [Phycisphaerae bacterium]|jgi:flagellar protein FliS|nr:flagellar export chaperone FliS [Phycisphaerae bacterium]HOB73608.1 flagellar export chaperone FliS [Phycisphaerae bacterium]HOJ54787.1 flagellar export chaperone FliS [Phycisphaerae bacterium]HOL25861.1 flagellar export chaperone FliS [Phycisphaerae bacterium]HPP21207.1 flagellar export chaperone FliS [Phycisphaerae bacterium]
MANASDAYFRNAVLTAPPEQLHLMLYDGAIRFTRQGIEGLESKNLESAFNGFSRAQKIVLEMLNSLNYKVDPVLCRRMASLYNFIYRKLVESSVQRDPAPARDALKLLEYQRETWVMLIEKLREERTGTAAGTNEPASPSPESVEAEYGTLSVQG